MLGTVFTAADFDRNPECRRSDKGRRPAKLDCQTESFARVVGIDPSPIGRARQSRHIDHRGSSADQPLRESVLCAVPLGDMNESGRGTDDRGRAPQAGA